MTLPPILRSTLALAALALVVPTAPAGESAPPPLLGFSPQAAATQRELEARLDAAVDVSNLRPWMERMTAHAHHVGSAHGQANADFMAGLFRSWGFETRIETYRSKDGDVTAFVLRLEQPFLAEQFEKSNKLRLEPAGKQAYLIYPKETKFDRKHAEFYGRLRGEGTAAVKLSYEVVTEDPGGKPRVDVRTAEIGVTVIAAVVRQEQSRVGEGGDVTDPAQGFLHLVRHGRIVQYLRDRAAVRKYLQLP